MSNMLNPYNQYKVNQVNTASQGDLLLMLYNGAIKFLHQGKIALENEDWKHVSEYFDRAQKIITELMLSLDTEKGGEVAENLYKLYFFIKQEILRSNLKKNSKNIDSIIGILKELRDAWKIIIERDKVNAGKTEEVAALNIKR